MKQKYIVIGLVVTLLVTAGIVGVALKARSSKPNSNTQVQAEPTPEEEYPTVDSSVSVTVEKSRVAANTVVISASGLSKKYTSVEYELTYESNSLIKGVNSGAKPLDVTGKDTFERDVYLGTCSRNVCTPDPGVTSVSVVLRFTDTDGNKSQFTKEYTL